MRFWLWLVSSLFLYCVFLSTAEQCGKQNHGIPCPGGLCCSGYGWCGTTDDYCLVEKGCQMNCTDGPDTPPPSPVTPPPSPPPPSPVTPPAPGGATLGDIISREMFETMFPYRNDPRCHAVNFYTYEAFIAAAKSYPAFAATGNDETRKREVAAFLGQTSHETTGGWPTADDGPDHWGYCYNKEDGCPSEYCDAAQVNYPCVPGQRYCGRGPIQLSWNANYGQYGDTIGLKDQLLQDADMLIKNVTMAFEASYWFWMTAQSPKPSCHDVITGVWTPSERDIQLGRLPGYGMLTNIINGGLECGHGGPDSRVEDRIAFYKRYTTLLGISTGDNLDCYNMTPYGPNGYELVESM
ncbi:PATHOGENESIS-RELATED 3, basic chitinase [Hibiscus trionum]|uniref:PATHOGENESIS-RELATED 3, basic chitinase n=1 Tax=Hibiscus trionum TaxID=183268 RepID=A0A9W7LRJ7_HIBTR|nr:PATHOGENESIS-RELATED 3, basic chitinase [Hibiscus trionum]